MKDRYFFVLLGTGRNSEGALNHDRSTESRDEVKVKVKWTMPLWTVGGVLISLS